MTNSMLMPSIAIHYAGFGKHLPSPLDPIIHTWLKYVYAFAVLFNITQVVNKVSM